MIACEISSLSDNVVMLDNGADGFRRRIACVMFVNSINEACWIVVVLLYPLWSA